MECEHLDARLERDNGGFFLHCLRCGRFQNLGEEHPFIYRGELKKRLERLEAQVQELREVEISRPYLELLNTKDRWPEMRERVLEWAEHGICNIEHSVKPLHDLTEGWLRCYRELKKFIESL